MKNYEEAIEWFKRAKSNLARAKMLKSDPDMVYEDFCYDAEQAVEKALKSLCILNDIKFPKTHSISFLIEILIKNGLEIPEDVKESSILSEYAVETRYPGDYDPVCEEDYIEAVEIAERTVFWIEKKL